MPSNSKPPCDPKTLKILKILLSSDLLDTIVTIDQINYHIYPELSFNFSEALCFCPMGCFPMFRSGLRTCTSSDSFIVSTLSDGGDDLVETGVNPHRCGETNFQASTKPQAVLYVLAAFTMEGMESSTTYAYRLSLMKSTKRAMFWRCSTNRASGIS